MTCGNPAGRNGEQSRIDGVELHKREHILKIFPKISHRLGELCINVITIV